MLVYRGHEIHLKPLINYVQRALYTAYCISFYFWHFLVGFFFGKVELETWCTVLCRHKEEKKKMKGGEEKREGNQTEQNDR